MAEKVVPVAVCSRCGFTCEIRSYDEIRNLRGEPFQPWKTDLKRHYDLTSHWEFYKAYAVKKFICYLYEDMPEKCRRLKEYGENFCEKCEHRQERWMVKGEDDQGHVITLFLKDEEINRFKKLAECPICGKFKFFKLDKMLHKNEKEKTTFFWVISLPKSVWQAIALEAEKRGKSVEETAATLLEEQLYKKLKEETK